MPQASSQFDSNTRSRERRAHLRQPVRSLAYVELGEGNGGIVLNISERGMAVQAVMSLGPGELPDMRVQLAHARKQIEAKGHMAWTDQLRRLAGIEFVELSEEAREQIREWISLESPALEPPDTPDTSVEKVSTAAATALAEAAPKPAASHGRSEIKDPFVEPARVKTPPGAAREPGAQPPAFAPAPQAPDPEVVAPVRSRAIVSSIRAALSSTVEFGPTDTEPKQPEALGRRTETSVGVSSAASSLTASLTAPRATDLPPDRFGFKPIATPDAMRQAESESGSGKRKLTVLVGIFLVVSLAVGWIVRRGTLPPALERPGPVHEREGAVVENVGERPAGASQHTSEIEVVDLSNQRWLVPMQAPTPNPHRSATSAVRSPRGTVETRPTPATVTSSSEGPEGSVSSPDAQDGGKPRFGISGPLQSVSAEDTGLQPGELLRKVEPFYPPAALAEKVEGTVKIFAAIDADGNIKTLQPVSGPRLLIPPALDAVRQWHYGPTLLNGRPIETQRQITVVFRMATNP